MSQLRTPPTRRPNVRQAEGEGIVRMIILALAAAGPLVSVAWITIQNTRMSYQISQVRAEIREADEMHRTLVLERSKFRRDEEIQSFAERSGMQLRKQSFLVHRPFTPQDQKLAKLRPVASDEFPR